MNPWIDGNDLRESDMKVAEGCTAYYWRDTNIIVIVDDETDEIVDIVEL